MSIEVTAREAVSGELHRECSEFLYREAQHLDHRRWNDWLAMLAEDLVYEMPVRMTLGGESDDEFARDAFHMKETYASIHMRVARHYSGHAYAEDPPSRTQRFVTNVLVAQRDGGDVDVTSNLLVYRSSGDGTTHNLIAAERVDVLRATDDGWKLAQRRVLLAHTTLVPPNNSLFL